MRANLPIFQKGLFVNAPEVACIVAQQEIVLATCVRMQLFPLLP